MSYNALNDVTGIGKFITIRNKETGVPFTLGMTEDEVAVSDGEQKYFIQQVQLNPDVSVEGDDTRYVYRIGYYSPKRWKALFGFAVCANTHSFRTAGTSGTAGSKGMVQVKRAGHGR